MPVTLSPALTLQQTRALAVAARVAPDLTWGDGIVRNICAQLEGDGPWDNAAVNAATVNVFADLGLDLPILPT
jgi:hypothetical protein